MASTVREITLDANVYEKKSVTIVEIMGRHAGWLTAASALARKYIGDNPLLIYLPETAFDTEEFLKKTEACFEKNVMLLSAFLKAFMIIKELLSANMTIL